MQWLCSSTRFLLKNLGWRVFPPPDRCQQGGGVTTETVSRSPQGQTPPAAGVQPVEVWDAWWISCRPGAAALIDLLSAFSSMLHVQNHRPASCWSAEVRGAKKHRLASHLEYNKHFFSAVSFKHEVGKERVGGKTQLFVFRRQNKVFLKGEEVNSLWTFGLQQCEIFTLR